MLSATHAHPQLMPLYPSLPSCADLGRSMADLACQCVVIAAEGIRLDDLQSLAQTCRVMRAAIAALPPAVWRASARVTVPASHPLRRASAQNEGIPAACSRLCAAYSGLARGSISARRISSEGATKLLQLQPDLVRLTGS